MSFELSVQKQHKQLALAATLPEGTQTVELRVWSDRNRPITRFSTQSPRAKATGILSPEIDNSRIEKDIWFPVVDVALDGEAEAQLCFAPTDDDANFAINGWEHRKSYAVASSVTVPATQLEHWENCLYIDGIGVKVSDVSLIWRFDVAVCAFKHQLTLLSEAWAGSVMLVALRDGVELGQATATVAVQPKVVVHHSETEDGLTVDRVVRSLNATLDCIWRRQNKTPWSDSKDGLYLFYDLEARTYRNSFWTWTWGPEIKLLLDAANDPRLTAQRSADQLRAFASALGEASLRFQVDDPADPVDGLYIARWDPSTQYPYGFGGHVSPPDGLFLVGWAWIPLYEATGDVRFLKSAEKMTHAVGQLIERREIVPQDYLLHSAEWKDWVVDEASFGMEGIAELHRVSPDDRFQAIGRRYMAQILAKFDADDGLWNRFFFIESGKAVPTEKHTRGLAWAMEGLLAAHRLLPHDGYLLRAKQLAQHLTEAQHESGYWSFLFDKAAENVGISEKGTAAWSLLFYRLYKATGEAQYLATARRALSWLINNQYFGSDPDAYGSVFGSTPHSGVVYRSWFNLSCTYTSGFFGLAALEELKLSGTTDA